MEGQKLQIEQIDQKIDAIILKRWHLTMGIAGFFLTFVFPVIAFGFSIDKKQSLIEKDINTIQLNHEAHMQTALEEIAEIKKHDSAFEADVLQQLKTQNDAIIQLLLIHKNEL